MHRDEAIYARADAHAITLTAEEAQLVAWALQNVKGWPRGLDWDATIAHSHRRAALAARLEAASTTPQS